MNWRRILFCLSTCLGLGCQLDLTGQRSSSQGEQVEEITHIVTDRRVLRGTSNRLRQSAAFSGQVTAEEVGTALNWWTGAGGAAGLAAAGAGIAKWRKRIKALKAVAS